MEKPRQMCGGRGFVADGTTDGDADAAGAARGFGRPASRAAASTPASALTAVGIGGTDVSTGTTEKHGWAASTIR